MSNKPEPCLGQIWTYLTPEESSFENFDETIRLFAKNRSGSFEYKTLSGNRGSSNSYDRVDIIDDHWIIDPNAEGSQYWRDLKDSP